MGICIKDISFSTSEYYIDLETLAQQNQAPEEKYLSGIGQKKISIAPPDEDIVTLGYKAASKIVNNSNRNAIKFLFFATESSFDNSKSAGIYLHELLNLDEDCRVIELKQACYSGTAALLLARDFLKSAQNPEIQCLVVTSDIAKYEPHSNAEPTQGAASVAVLLSVCSRNSIAGIEDFGGVITKNTNDFSKPNYLKYPFVNGKLSIVTYLSFLKKSLSKFAEETGITPKDFEAICYHTPFPKITFKANDLLLKIEPELSKKPCFSDITPQIAYNAEIGNVYTASLFLSLISLLENSSTPLEERKIGMFSYGSGSTAEFFCLRPLKSYQEKLAAKQHKKLIESRKLLGYKDYLDFHEFEYHGELVVPKHTKSTIRLASIGNNIRNYEFL